VAVKGGRISGGRIGLDCGESSQYLSALLLIAPYTENGIEIEVVRGPVSRPYIDMTLSVMERFGVAVAREGYTYFRVPGKTPYRPGSYRVEPDCSQAGYFWAAAAVTGSPVTVRGIPLDSRQGDLRFLEILESMGCRVARRTAGITVTGGPLSAVDVDMGDIPDLVPTLAVVAAFARGTTVIRNVAHLRVKESDRLSAVSLELGKTGIEAETNDSGISIRGGRPRGAVIDPHGDHRLAMSFAVCGLAAPGIFIENESCVEKSFPEFWKTLEGLYER
jgi:3-phosphoshikimate 1-carboxyvinyltransferase